MNESKTILIIAALLCALAVILGAFGAHGLKEVLLANDKLEVYKTAVQYHIFHALALFIPGILIKMGVIKNATPITILFLTGLILFSGSLYLLSISGWNKLGIITPFGGMAFIFAWIILAFKVYKS